MIPEQIDEVALVGGSTRIPRVKQLVRELGLRGGEDRRQLEERLQKLVDRGELVLMGRDRYALPKAAAKHNLVAGELSVHRDGYGFVRPQDPAVRDRIEGDIYVSPRDMNAAMHGDNVLVELGPGRGDGRAEGRVVKVVGRAHPTVVGVDALEHDQLVARFQLLFTGRA